MSSTLRIGVIGVGGIARTHMPGWAKSPLAEVFAGADLSAEVLDQWGEEHGVDPKRRYADPADLIADPDVDVVDVCTPSSYHAPLAIAALEAGKHVLCEKPLAPTPGEIERMIAARDASGKLLMTAQHMRFQAQNRAAKKEIDAGRLGDVYHARAWWLRRGGVPNSPGFIYMKNAGGGPCIDLGVHYLDLALWLMGHPTPVSVTGVAGKPIASRPGAFSDWGNGSVIPDDMDVEEFAAGFVRFDNGASLVLEVSWLLHHPQEDMKLWLYGDRGGLCLPDATLHHDDNERMQRYDVQLKRTSQPRKGWAEECVAFAEAIVEGRPSPVPPEQSLAVQRVLAGLYESQKTGREVRLDA
ncbi:MAG: Gfo/Idh/MocA family oxidoreductase [Planctomycetota bacterium]